MRSIICLCCVCMSGVYVCVSGCVRILLSYFGDIFMCRYIYIFMLGGWGGVLNVVCNMQGTWSHRREGVYLLTYLKVAQVFHTNSVTYCCTSLRMI